MTQLNKSKIIPLIAVFALVCGCIFYAVPMSADADDENFVYSGETQKEEVIYAALDNSGSIRDMYIVNIFNVNAPEKITEYGSYSRVENLTNDDEITLKNDKVTIDAETDDRLYYQGDVTGTDLPWKFDITYRLNGKEVSADSLPGQDGDFELHISSVRNTDFDDSYYENYMLQVTIPLDAGKFTEIEAEGAQIANVGSEKQIIFTVLPGQDADIDLRASVTDFEMGQMQIAAVPFSMAIELPEDLIGGVEDLATALKRLDEGVAALESGAIKLDGGMSTLSSFSTTYLDGMRQLDASSIKIKNAYSSALDEMKKFKDMMDLDIPGLDVSSFKDLPSELYKFRDILYDYSDYVNALYADFDKFCQDMDSAFGAMPAGPLDQTALDELYANNPGNTALDQLMQTYNAAHNAKNIYTSSASTLSSVKTVLADLGSSLDFMGDTLGAIADLLDQLITDSPVIDIYDEFMKEVDRMVDGYEELYGYLEEYTGSVSMMAGYYEEINSGIQQSAEGTEQLKYGTATLHNGTKLLVYNTENMPAQIEEFMSSYDGSDFEPTSFASAKNGTVAGVQFVLQTDPIKKADEKPKTDTEETDESLWEKIKKLFD